MERASASLSLAALGMDATGGTTNTGTEGYYLWTVPGKPGSIQVDFDVVDRLSKEILRGFGVVPRRSVEVGGFLLGSVVRHGDSWVVRIDDFEPIPCQHSRGTSFLLSDEEQMRFEDVLARWHPAEGRATHAVGFYRSHTRQGLGLTAEDLEMYNRYFPDPTAVVLLVKPFATRASVGAFFFREDGQMRTESSYQEFPFRRRDLGGGEPLAAGEQEGGTDEMAAGTYVYPQAAATGDQTAIPNPAPGKKLKGGWVWIPLSFIFLLLGVVLGFQVAVSVSSQLPAGLRQDPYALNLTATPSGESVHVRWERNSPAIQASTRGSLVIRDGGAEKTVTLDASQLKNGSVIYRRASDDLHFRLEVTARDRVTVSESLAYRAGSATPSK